jgi:hypothetical protein
MVTVPFGVCSANSHRSVTVQAQVEEGIIIKTTSIAIMVPPCATVYLEYDSVSAHVVLQHLQHRK